MARKLTSEEERTFLEALAEAEISVEFSRVAWAASSSPRRDPQVAPDDEILAVFHSRQSKTVPR